jgi:thiosulfate dehydrogenase (quinone) large subunit
MIEKAVNALTLSWPLVVARIGLGVSFLASDHGAGAPDELAGFLARAAARPTYPWYASLVQEVVLPHIDLFGALVIIGEIYVGVALILGVTTRLAAGVALFLCLNYLAAKGGMPWAPGIDQSDILLSIVILGSAAGRVLGIDRYLHDRFPKIILW